MKKKIFGIITLVLTMFALVTVSGCKQLADEVNDAVSKATIVKVWKLTPSVMGSSVDLGGDMYAYFNGSRMYAILDKDGNTGEAKVVDADYTLKNGKLTITNVTLASAYSMLSTVFFNGAEFDCTVKVSSITIRRDVYIVTGTPDSTKYSASNFVATYNALSD